MKNFFLASSCFVLSVFLPLGANNASAIAPRTDSTNTALEEGDPAQVTPVEQTAKVEPSYLSTRARAFLLGVGMSCVGLALCECKRFKRSFRQRAPLTQSVPPNNLGIGQVIEDLFDAAGELVENVSRRLSLSRVQSESPILDRVLDPPNLHPLLESEEICPMCQEALKDVASTDWVRLHCSHAGCKECLFNWFKTQSEGQCYEFLGSERRAQGKPPECPACRQVAPEKSLDWLTPNQKNQLFWR